MSKKNDLYDGVMMDHIKNARNYRKIINPTHTADGNNPLCGDSFTVYLVVNESVIVESSFQCECCGISMASASIMTETISGKTVSQAQEAINRFRIMMKSESIGTEVEDDLTAVLGIVRKFPSRLNCALLGWETLATIFSGKTNFVMSSTFSKTFKDAS